MSDFVGNRSRSAGKAAGLFATPHNPGCLPPASGAKLARRNLAKRQLAEFVPPSELMGWLDERKLDAVIHLGAISETTATDGDLVIETNFRFSMRLLDWCTANATPFIYASSAATYGDGAQGFRDEPSISALKKLRPMNLYGWSKHLFDMAVTER